MPPVEEWFAVDGGGGGGRAGGETGGSGGGWTVPVDGGSGGDSPPTPPEVSNEAVRVMALSLFNRNKTSGGGSGSSGTSTRPLAVELLLPGAAWAAGDVSWERCQLLARGVRGLTIDLY
jgi:hypothetical protein